MMTWILQSHAFSVGEISEAENKLVRFTQSGSYQEQLSALKSNKDVKTSSSLAKLDLFLQDGIFRSEDVSTILPFLALSNTPSFFLTKLLSQIC